jgi:tRNA-specific 2-thiouridylase
MDAKKNIIYVSEKKDAFRSQLIAEDVHFIPFNKLSKKLEVKAKVRYVSKMSQATITPHAKMRVKVQFRRRQWAPTPGQSVVFYQNDTVLGGGIIKEIL